MRRVLIRAGIVAASLLAPFALNAPLAQVSAASASALPARVIVKFRASSPVLRMQAQAALSQHAVQAQALGQRIGIALTAGRATSERSQVVFASGMTSHQLAARIGAESDVEYAVADEKKYIVAAPNDSFYATRAVTASAGGPAVGQWYLKPPGAGRLRHRRRHRAGGDQRRAGLGHHHRQRQRSSSPTSTPASASIIPTCRATSCPATTW